MLQVFSMPCGFLELDSKLFFPNQETGSPLVVPVPCYLITHPQGNVLFDTGVHCKVMDDPVGRLGPEVSNLIVSRTKPGEEIVAQLSKFKLTPDDISHVVNSHFHFDHAGGNEFFSDLDLSGPKERAGRHQGSGDAGQSPARSPGL
jgi:glyoxylase-like metal-dependent hydrolase (beta-lactamase superfamily II)